MAVANLILISSWTILAAILIAVLIRGKVYDKFPMFSVYAVYSLLYAVALLLSTSHYRAYFLVYWVNEAVSALLTVLALHEVFRKVFSGAEQQFWWFRFVFPGVMVLAVLTVVWQELAHPPVESSRITGGILLFALIVNFIQLGIFCLFFFLAKILPLKWRLAPLGILLGFAFGAAGSAMYYWLRSTFGNKLPSPFDLLPPVAYLIGLGVWLHTFWHPEPEPEWPSVVVMSQIAEQMREETEVIRRFLDKLK